MLVGLRHFPKEKGLQETNVILGRLLKIHFWHQLAVSTNFHHATYDIEILPSQIVKLSKQMEFSLYALIDIFHSLENVPTKSCLSSGSQKVAALSGPVSSMPMRAGKSQAKTDN